MMGCGPSKSSLSRVADSTCEYNRCYMKEFDKARRKQKKSGRQNRRRMPTYNNFSSTTKVYDRTSGTSKITVRLSTDGSMLEIEQFDVEYDSTDIPEVSETADEDHGLVMKSVSELKALHDHNLYARSDSAPLLLSNISGYDARSNKQTGCGLTSCCMQNRSGSRTMSDEYRLKSTGIEDCYHYNEKSFNHNCDVHETNETNKNLSEGKSLDSDSLNSTALPQTDDSVKAVVESETNNEDNEVFEKATIHVIRSTLEQQVKDACNHGIEHHAYYTCTSFKPRVHTEPDQHENNFAGNHVCCCRKHSLCIGTSNSTVAMSDNEIFGKSQNSKSMIIGVNDSECTELNETKTSPINNHENRLENVRAENNQLGRTCSVCNTDMSISKKYELNSMSNDCVNDCHCHDSCRADEIITQTNTDSNKQGQSSRCSEYETKTNMRTFCCCYLKGDTIQDCCQQQNYHQHYKYQHQQRLAAESNEQSSSDNTNENTNAAPNRDKTLTGSDIVAMEPNCVNDSRVCANCGRKSSCVFRQSKHRLNDTGINATSFSASSNDGKVFQTTYGYKSVISHDMKQSNGVTDFLQIRRCHELSNQRPCVPNRTVNQNQTIFQTESPFLQKSILSVDTNGGHICHEPRSINQHIECVHNEKETLKVDNNEPVAMETNDASNAVLTDDERVYGNSQHTGNNYENKCCHHCDDSTNVVDNEVYHDTCSCGQRLSILPSEQYRMSDYQEVGEEKYSDNTDMSGETHNSEKYSFCEYESVMIRDDRGSDGIYDVKSDSRKNGDDGASKTPLIRQNSIHSSSSIERSSDNDDFDDSSGDECRDVYVDALETTYV